MFVLHFKYIPLRDLLVKVTNISVSFLHKRTEYFRSELSVAERGRRGKGHTRYNTIE